MENIQNYKLVVSGQSVELITILKPKEKMFVKYDYKREFVKNTNIRLDNIRRTKSRLIRLIRSNPDLDRFITLTFNTDVKSLTLAHAFFRSFIQKMKYRYFDLPFKYIAVPEFQSGGRVHYHILCNIPFLENSLLEEIWGRGFTFIEKTYGTIDSVAYYLASYLIQEVDCKLFSRRRYFYSLTCNQPRVFITSNYFDIINIISKLELVHKFSMDMGFGIFMRYYLYRIPQGFILKLPPIKEKIKIPIAKKIDMVYNKNILTQPQLI